jgi:hypothetical protein
MDEIIIIISEFILFTPNVVGQVLVEVGSRRFPFSIGQCSPEVLTESSGMHQINCEGKIVLLSCSPPETVIRPITRVIYHVKRNSVRLTYTRTQA